MASKNESSTGRNINSSNEYSKSSYIKWGLEEPRRKHLDTPDHAVSNNKNNNQLNGIITTEMEFYYNYNIDNLVNITQLVVSFDIRAGKSSRETYVTGLRYLLDNLASDIMIKQMFNHISSKLFLTN